MFDSWGAMSRWCSFLECIDFVLGSFVRFGGFCHLCCLGNFFFFFLVFIFVFFVFLWYLWHFFFTIHSHYSRLLIKRSTRSKHRGKETEKYIISLITLWSLGKDFLPFFVHCLISPANSICNLYASIAMPLIMLVCFKCNSSKQLVCCYFTSSYMHNTILLWTFESSTIGPPLSPASCQRWFYLWCYCICFAPLLSESLEFCSINIERKR